ncbi:MAG: chemotaxis protein CheW [Deltaproteobacteria bacterium]|nr:chemotaxis protein CheW [Deltaproteobacteria bacterium]
MATKQFVTFRIEGHLMGIDVRHVREVNRSLDVTPVPLSPDYVLGLVNLRGQILTIFDLRVRLGLESRAIDAETHNIVLKLDDVGLLVDAISEVIMVDENEIEPPPANIGDIEAYFINGVVKLEQELLIFLSARKLINYRQSEG